METYVIRDVSIKAEGKQIALLAEATVKLDLSKIEVVIDEVLLSSETMGLLQLSSDETPKEVDVSGKADGKSLTVKRAILRRLTFDAKKGEAVRLRNISIIGLGAEWNFEK